MRAVPHYLTTPWGQIRLWVAGEGRPVLVLPGLIRAAETVASDLAEQGLTAHALELPSEIPLGNLRLTIRRVAETLGLTQSVLAYDLSAALYLGCVALDSYRARGWRQAGLIDLDPTLRIDGTHLTAIHAHIRNAHLLSPGDPGRADRGGPALPDAEALHAATLAAAVKPERYTALWNDCLRSAATIDGPATLAEALAQLGPGPTQVRLPKPSPSPPISCDYVDIPRGRMHLRVVPGRGRPLVMLHSAPGGSAPLSNLMLMLALADGAERPVIAPDYLGNGLSSKPDGAVDIARLGQDVVDMLAALDLPQVDLWGTHTGALVALEAALIAPERTNRLVLEAPPLLSPSFTADILENYLPPIRPDPWGLHLQQAWNMRRDMFLFWPWYRRERAAIRPLDLPDAAFLHDWTIGLLQSGRTYDRSYRAAFEYDARARLPLLARPALVCAGPSDMLADGLAEAARLNPLVTAAATPATVWYPNQDPEAVAETVITYLAALSDSDQL